jgi:hypothetical protein
MTVRIPSLWIGGLIVAIGLGTFWWWRPLHKVSPGRATRSTSTTTPRPSSFSTVGASTPKTSGNAAQHSQDYKALFAGSHDYLAFARLVLPSAKAGNPDAQYYLSRALEYCEDVDRSYFSRHGQRLNLDQAIQYAAQLHRRVEVVQIAYDRCHELSNQGTSEFGTAQEWLASATKAGQPLAQSVTASKLLIQEMLQQFARAGAVPTSIHDPSTVVADPRELLYKAVQSREPEVLLDIGEAYPMLHPNDPDRDVVRYAWMLLACERGLNCTAGSELLNDRCYDWDSSCDSASSPEDYVQSLAGNKWPEVQQRASEIGSELDQGEWGELGLGSH